MCPVLNNLPTQNRRGFSLVEVVVSMALLVVLSGITVTGMIYHSRIAQSNLSKQKTAESARRFVGAAHIEAMDATIMEVSDGPAGPGTVLTLGHPDPADPTRVVFKQYAYLDGDNNRATIRDNRIVERTVNTPDATTGKTIVEYCAPPPGKPVFTYLNTATLPMVQIQLRIGDQSNPPSAADNAVTGRGYQSFLINAFITKGT